MTVPADYADLCRFLPTLGGTTDWVYSSAVAGCQSPALANVQIGFPYRVYAVDNPQNPVQWEISTGVIASVGTFPRTTVLYNSSGTGTAQGQSGAGTKINFSTVPQVSVVALAEDLRVRKNYTKNPGFRIAQRYGTSGPTVVGGSNQNLPFVDRWRCAANGTGSIAASQVATRTPGGSPNRAQFVVTTPDAAVAAGSWYYIEQKIAAWDADEWGLGTAGFVPNLTCRLGVNAPAGTYGVALINNNDTFSYTTTFTIAAGEAGTDVYKTVNFPGANSIGPWGSGGTNGPIGAVLLIDLGSGSNANTAGGAWVNSLHHNTAGQYSWIGTNANVFQLFDTQLEIGPMPGPFILPSYAQDLQDCYMFLQPVGKNNVLTYGFAIAQSTTIADFFVKLSPPMPGIDMTGAPVIALNTTGTVTDYTIGNYAGGAPINCSVVPALVGYSKDQVHTRWTVAAGLVAAAVSRLQAASSTVWLFVDNQI